MMTLAHLHIDGIVVHGVVVVKLEMVEAGREINVRQLPGHPVEYMCNIGVFRNKIVWRDISQRKNFPRFCI